MLHRSFSGQRCLLALTLCLTIGCGSAFALDNYKTLLERGTTPAEVKELHSQYVAKVLFNTGADLETIERLAGEGFSDSFMLACLSNGWVIRARDVNHDLLPPSGVWVCSEKDFKGHLRQFPSDCKTYNDNDIAKINPNDVNSILIGCEVKVQLHDEQNFGGDSVYFKASQRTLSNRVRSMKVRTAPRLDYVTLSKYVRNAETKLASFKLHLSGANVDDHAKIVFGDCAPLQATVDTRMDNSGWLGLGDDLAEAGYHLDPCYYAFPIYHYDSLSAEFANVACDSTVCLCIENPDGQRSNKLLFTVPNDKNLDSDGDGLLDDWETGKVLVDGLDLTRLNADPQRKDLYVEVDRMIVGNRVWSDFSKSDYPRNSMFDHVVTLFEQSPVLNPDGSSGIAIHIDYGQENFEDSGRGKGGTEIKWKRYIGFRSAEKRNSEKKKNGKDLIPPEDYVDAIAIRGDPASFDLNRHKVFRYCIFGDQQWRSRSTGGGNHNTTFFVSLGVCRLRAIDHNYQMAIFVHELGHTLGLRHTGNKGSFNYKPNFNSLMNYTYTFTGRDIDGKLGGMKTKRKELGGDDVFAYSEGMRSPLDEKRLYEALGVANHYPYDWDGDGQIDAELVEANVRRRGKGKKGGTPKRHVVDDYPDWAKLRLEIK